MAAGATYEPIQTYTVSGTSTNTISFTSIAATYTDLRIVTVYRDTTNGGANGVMKFNSDSGTNYSYTTLQGNGSAASSSRNINSSGIVINNNSGSGSSNVYWEFNSVDIFSYAGSTYKTSLLTQNFDRNGSGEVSGKVALWRNTAAITRIDITIDASCFYSAGSTFTLYGIKAA